jgi:hypothetical protein
VTPVSCEVTSPKRQSSIADITEPTARVLFVFPAKVEETVLHRACNKRSTPLDEIGGWFPLRISTDERNHGTTCECFCVIDTDLY